MYYYPFLPDKVVHTFSGCALHQCEPHMEVTNFLLTQESMEYRMPLAFKHCSRRSYTTEPSLTEPHAQRRH
jgi:hypothetical protein